MRLQFETESLELTIILISSIEQESRNFKVTSAPPFKGSEYSAGESLPKSSNTILIGYDKQYIGILY